MRCAPGTVLTYVNWCSAVPIEVLIRINKFSFDPRQTQGHFSIRNSATRAHHFPKNKSNSSKGRFEMMRWTLSLLAGFWLAAPAMAADDAAAEALMKKSGCFKCHSVSAKKDGPSYKSVAEKYKGKADAEQKLYTHLTTSPKVKVDGKEEMHETLKT